MSDNREISDSISGCDYNTLTSLINYNYSVTHNYDFKYLIPNLDGRYEVNNCLSPSNKLRHSSWSKLLSTIKVIKEYEGYELIIYIDSDCIFNDFSKSIEDYMSQSKNIKNYPLNLDSHIFFMNSQPWSFELPCAGFYIIKNTTESLKFIQNWYLNDSHPHYDKTHIWEQYPLQYELNDKYSSIIDIIDDWMFRPKDGQYLRHIGSEEYYNRIPFFTNYLLQNFSMENIDKILTDIKEYIIHYNTNEILEKI